MKSYLKLSILLLVAYATLAIAEHETSTNILHESSQETTYKRIFFLGESCVGKTTLMQHLCARTDEFYMPKFTTTRAARQDDDPELFEYVSVEAYLESRCNGEFFFDTDDGKTYYGYKNKHMLSCDKHALLYGSPFFVEQIKKIPNSFIVLIESKPDAGFNTRNDSEELKQQRKLINQQLREQFFNNSTFRKKIDLIVYNTFENPTSLPEQLYKHLQALIAQT